MDVDLKGRLATPVLVGTQQNRGYVGRGVCQHKLGEIRHAHTHVHATAKRRGVLQVSGTDGTGDVLLVGVGLLMGF